MSGGFRVSDSTIETAVRAMHDAYETAATANGWETNPASRKPWADVPEANKATMRAALAAVLPSLVAEIREQIAGEIETQNPMEGQYAPQWNRGLRWAAGVARGDAG
jgi:hypothetical protein